MQLNASEIWPPAPRRRLYLMRHGEVDYFDEAGRPHRPDLVSLNERGREQACAAAVALAEVAIDLAVSSGLPRSDQTAEIVVAGRAVPLERDARLREIGPGRMTDWAGVAAQDVRRAILGALPHDLDPQATFLAGETFAELVERTEAAWRDLLGRGDWQTLLVVSHGIANRVLLCRLLGAPLGGVGKVEQDAGCLNVIDFDTAGVPLLRLMNHTPGNPSKRGMRLSTLEGLYRQFLGGRPECEG